jgi:hypothetical protein
MSTSSDDVQKRDDDALSSETVADWLRQNPGFLNDHPDLLAALTPPEFHQGETVLDMQRFMLERLQSEVIGLKGREADLIDATKSNAMVQGRIHAAVKGLLEAASLEDMIKLIIHKLPRRFDLASVVLCIETGDNPPAAFTTKDVVALEPGALETLLGKGRNKSRTVTLRSNIKGEEAIFGAKAAKVRSAALLQLDFGDAAPKALLALGSRSTSGFDPRQGTEMLSFFARVLESSIKRWLAP